VDPLTLLAEWRGLFWAFWLSVKGPQGCCRRRVRRCLIVTTHPIQYRLLYFEHWLDGSMRNRGSYVLTLPDAQLQGVASALPSHGLCLLLERYIGEWQRFNPESRGGDQAQITFVLWLAKPMGCKIGLWPRKRVMPDALLESPAGPMLGHAPDADRLRGFAAYRHLFAHRKQ